MSRHNKLHLRRSVILYQRISGRFAINRQARDCEWRTGTQSPIFAPRTNVFPGAKEKESEDGLPA